MTEGADRGPAGAATATEVLAHLYQALDYLAAISEATNSGAVARAGRATQHELWAAVALLGGDRDGYLTWDAQRREAARRQAGDRRGPI